MTAEPGLPELSDSTFYMLRCVVAVAAADNLIRSQELLFLNNLLIHFRKQASVTQAQVARLQDDLKYQQPVEVLLPKVTSRPDREQLVLFAGLMAQSDGEVHPSEAEVLRKISAYCTPAPANDAVPASPDSAPSIPGFDMASFKHEIRSIVQQEFFKHALATSGVARKTGPVAVADAFAERNPAINRPTTYEMIVGDAGHHRAVLFPGESAEPTLPRTPFGLKTALKLLFFPILLLWASAHADMVFASFTYHQLMALDRRGFSPENYERLVNFLSSPLWGTLPGQFLRAWALLSVIWKLYAHWISGRLSPLMRQTIVPGEHVLGKARFHFFFMADVLLLAGIFWAVSFKINMFLAEQTYHAVEYLSNHEMLAGAFYDRAYRLFADPYWGSFPAKALRWLAFFVVSWRLLRAWTTEILVTDSRLLFRQGILRINTLKIDISNLGQVDVKQSWLGLLLGFGSVHIYTNNWSGKGSEVEAAGIEIPPVADPHTFSTLVDRARRMWRKGKVT